MARKKKAKVRNLHSFIITITNQAVEIPVGTKRYPGRPKDVPLGLGDIVNGRPGDLEMKRFSLSRGPMRTFVMENSVGLDIRQNY